MIKRWIQSIVAYFRRLCSKKETETNEQDHTALVTYCSQNAERFSGLYEPLYQLAGGKSELGAFLWEEWDIRMDTEEGAPLFQEAFGVYNSWDKEQSIRQAEKFLLLLQQAGIQRDMENTLIADNSTAKFYQLQQGGFLQLGVEYRIVVPAWRSGANCLEKGILTYE